MHGLHVHNIILDSNKSYEEIDPDHAAVPQGGRM